MNNAESIKIQPIANYSSAYNLLTSIPASAAGARHADAGRLGLTFDFVSTAPQRFNGLRTSDKDKVSNSELGLFSDAVTESGRITNARVGNDGNLLSLAGRGGRD
jgi:hypothetical protein